MQCFVEIVRITNQPAKADEGNAPCEGHFEAGYASVCRGALAQNVEGAVVDPPSATTTSRSAKDWDRVLSKARGRNRAWLRDGIKMETRARVEDSPWGA